MLDDVDVMMLGEWGGKISLSYSFSQGEEYAPGFQIYGL
jgi:hypothetical protein